MDLGARFRAAATLLASHRDVLDGRPVALPTVTFPKRSPCGAGVPTSSNSTKPPSTPWKRWASRLRGPKAHRPRCAISRTTFGRRAASPWRRPSRTRAPVRDASRRRGSTARSRRSQNGSYRSRRGRSVWSTWARDTDISPGPSPTVSACRCWASNATKLSRTRRAPWRSPGAPRSPSPTSSRGLGLSSRDCVVGLHACGELGDAMVESAARSGASIALIGCCLQKRRAASRSPLAWDAEGDDVGRRALEFPKFLLGLSHLTAREEGVETSRVENLRARERRLALHRLLREAGVALALGAEIEGLNRRAAHAPLDTLVARAFERRGLAVPGRAALDAAAGWAAMQHGRMRRLALPRSLLGRLLEVFVLLDRGCHLERSGFAVDVSVAFPAAVSARNLALVAARAS
ncbi:MAG: methyltransferase [Polyangiaceae bacterium]